VRSFDYQPLKAELARLLAEEEQRLAPEFDPSENYTLDDLSALVRDHALLHDIYDAADAYGTVRLELEKVLPRDRSPNGEEIRAAYELIANLKSARLGRLPANDKEDLERLVSGLDRVDRAACEHLSRQFMYYSDRFSSTGEQLSSDRALSFTINDAFLRFECFFASSLASILHLMRETSTTTNGVLARIVLCRSTMESALLLRFVTYKFQRLADQIETTSFEKALERFESFPRLYLRAMYGSGLPDAADKPHHVNDCIKSLPTNASSATNRSSIQATYDLLCDYAHPNLSMRELLVDFGPTPGDYFTTSMWVDESLTGESKQALLIDILVTALTPVVALVDEAIDLREQAREMLNDKNVSTFDGKLLFNGVTSPDPEVASARAAIS